MRNTSWGLLFTLLAACGSNPSSGTDAASSPRPDAAAVAGADAGSPPAADSGTPGSTDAATLAGPDAGTTAKPDGGPLSCKLEPSTAAVKMVGFQQEFDLADLTAGDGKIGIAYSWNKKFRKLMVVEAATGTELADATLTDLEGYVIPKAADYADGLFFVAGNYDLTGDPPYVRFGYYDATGAQTAWKQVDDFLAMSVAREKAGARVLALGKVVGAEQPIYVNRYDAAGALTDSFELGRDTRKKNEWDLSWQYAEDKGVACGVAPDGADDYLGLWELPPSATSTLHKSAVKLAAAATADLSTFGCRVAMAAGASAAAVALSDGAGGSQLVWLGLDGSTAAGPLPFAAYKTALKYDVAASGKVTALAHLDESSGTPHAVVKIFPSPGQTPIELNAEADLNLGTFDFIGRRVRLAPIDGGFAVAYDASIKIGQTDLYVRRILCE